MPRRVSVASRCGKPPICFGSTRTPSAIMCQISKAFRKASSRVATAAASLPRGHGRSQRVLLETGRIKPDRTPSQKSRERGQVVTIFNLKGGSAKTSTVAHVGQLLGLSRAIGSCLSTSTARQV